MTRMVTLLTDVCTRGFNWGIQSISLPVLPARLRIESIYHAEPEIFDSLVATR
jgi:hypothetical protein